MSEGKIEKQAKAILTKYPQLKSQPASISGKYHKGETCREHLEQCVSIMKHLCDAFSINENDRDMLIACAYLHDLGLALITHKSDMGEKEGWAYYEKTGYSRSHSVWKLHSMISATMLDDYEIDRKEEIKNIIVPHMWPIVKEFPKPNDFYAKLLKIADYLSSRSSNIFNYLDNNAI